MDMYVQALVGLLHLQVRRKGVTFVDKLVLRELPDPNSALTSMFPASDGFLCK